MKVKSSTCTVKYHQVARKAAWGLKYTQSLSDPTFKTGTPENDQILLRNLIAFYCVLEGIFFYLWFYPNLGYGSSQQNEWCCRAIPVHFT